MVLPYRHDYPLIDVLTVLQAMDKNKDGFITKGELKLAKKNVGMNQIEGVIKKYDMDKDGKLNMEEFRQSVKKP